MAITLDITGVLQAAAFWVSNKGGSNGWKLYLYFYLLLTFLSVVLGNDPVILSGTVFLVYYTQASSINPLAWLFSEFAAANTASMVLFVGNPTNVVICEGFAIHQAGFTAYTILPFLACSFFCFVTLGLQFRTQIPRTIDRAQRLDPRLALHDVVGAWVGGLILAGCLVTVVAASFFGVEVWKITLPFALAKFVFDFCWDHYRFIKGKNPSRAMNIIEPVMLSELPPKVSADHIAMKTDVSRRSYLDRKHKELTLHFPTFFTALPRLPLALVPFAFSQFILIEALAHQGWIEIFGKWLSYASRGHMHAVIWLCGIVCIFLCNITGTNIGATILLTKVVHATPFLQPDVVRAAGIALAIGSNIGAVSFVYSASLAGLLWKRVLKDKDVAFGQLSFARWNMLPLLTMTVVGLGVVSAELEVLKRR